MKKSIVSVWVIFVSVLSGILSLVFNPNIIFEKNDVFHDDILTVAAEVETKEALPEAYCLRDDYMIFTQNQDQNGYCWNFAGTMSAATTIMKATNEYYDFSELWTGVGYSSMGSFIPGDGGTFGEFAYVAGYKGLMLEGDLPYAESYTNSKENNNLYSDWYNRFSNKDIIETLSYDNVENNFPSTLSYIPKIKNHIFNHGSMYLGFQGAGNEFLTNDNGVYYKIPNYSSGGSHAVSVIGWDDNFEKEIYLNGADTPTTFKGAWIILNSWGSSSGKDGVSYIFYSDTQIQQIQGFEYKKDTTKSLYFYNKLEKGYDYYTDLKGYYYGNYTNSTNLTKQKNIFFTDDINLEYSYDISNSTDIESITFYYNNIDITDRFSVNINKDERKINITANDLDFGQYKILMKYSNGTYSDTYLNNFYVYNSLIVEEVEIWSDDSNFTNGRDLVYFQTNEEMRTFDLYTQKTSGTFKILIYLSNYSTPVSKLNSAKYEFKTYGFANLNYNIVNSKSQHTILLEASNGDILKFYFNINYEKDQSMQTVKVKYDLAGGENHEENRSVEIANATNDLAIYEPTREGYVFLYWQIISGSQPGLKTEGVEGVHYIGWEDIYNIGSNPTLYAKTYYQTYYNNSNFINLRATWKEVERYTVTVTIEGEGTYEADKEGPINKFGSVTYLFYPAEGWTLYKFIHNGYPVSYEELISIEEHGYKILNITENQAIKAIFIKKLYTIEASSGTNGTISSMGSSDVEHGDSKTYVFTPQNGYRVKDVKIDGVSIGPVDSYTFSNITKQHTIEVEFELEMFNIQITIVGNGTVECGKLLKNILPGEERTLTIKAKKGWSFDSIYVNGNKVELVDDKLVLTINEDLNIKAIFKENEKLIIFGLDITTIAIIGGASLFLFVLIILIVKLNKKKSESSLQKRRIAEFNSNSSNNLKQKSDLRDQIFKQYNKFGVDKNNQIQPTQANNKSTSTNSYRNPYQSQMLTNAKTFVSTRENHFKSFCAKFNIDYRSNYDEAVLSYYKAYLRSKRK